MKCDICGQEVATGQARFGGRGKGDHEGPAEETDRHYACHEKKYGRRLAKRDA